ncbi:MAG: HAD-IB family hydrolase [Actinobacteria bacterium]|nr:HAD-IB family hydrolase [Actinomycetota bacterium]
MAAAAFFDLDRTLLAGASGPAITAALKAVGLLQDRHIPGEDLVFKVFNAVGENRPSMMLTRQAARLAAGWNTSIAERAGEAAANTLAGQVQPYARVLFDEHHREGRKVVVATTTPDHLVRPLAEALGADDVVATIYERRDGRFTGNIDGEFVWGKGKYRAVKEWAAKHDIDLSESYAYSDSYYDVPLLNAVGHPVVVNPDPRMRVQAIVRRWPTISLDAPPGVPKLFGLEPQQVIMPISRPELVPYADIGIDGTDNIPLSGPAILVGNHRSYFDPLAIGYAVAKRGRPVRFLGKKEVFDAPIIGDLARAMGGIRVERGSGSDEPLKEAAAALEAGEVVVIMPQGTIPRGRAFFDPKLKGRWGAARLAAMTRAPVIPMGVWGTEKVWPRNAKVPLVWNVLDRPTVSISIGTAVDLSYDDPDEDTERIMDAIVDQLPPEAKEWHEPTAAELARTLPSTYEGDPADLDHEEDRRPGTD